MRGPGSAGDVWIGSPATLLAVLLLLLPAVAGCLDPADRLLAPPDDDPEPDAATTRSAEPRRTGASAATAIVIASLPYTHALSTQQLGGNRTEDTDCGPIGASRWFEHTADGSGGILTDTTGSNYDTLLVVYALRPDGETVAIACNDDSVDFSARTGFLAEDGTTYYIRAGGYGADRGRLRLSVDWYDYPANALRAQAIPIPALPYENTQTTIGAVTESGEDLSCAPMEATVWYILTAGPLDVGILAIDTFGSDFDTMLAVHAEVAGFELPLACNDDAGDGLQSSVRVPLLPGATYWVQVGGYAGETGDLVLNATLVP